MSSLWSLAKSSCGWSTNPTTSLNWKKKSFEQSCYGVCWVQAMVPVWLPIEKSLLAQIPQRSLTWHNGLYLAHSMIPFNTSSTLVTGTTKTLIPSMKFSFPSPKISLLNGKHLLQVSSLFSHPKYPSAFRGFSKGVVASHVSLVCCHWVGCALECTVAHRLVCGYILEGAIPPPHCTELLLVFRLLYTILDDHTRILESKIIKIEILPPEFVFWSAKFHVWQSFTKYPSVVYLNKLLRNSKKLSLFKMTWWGFCLQEHLWSSIVVLPWEDKLCLKVKSMAYSHLPQEAQFSPMIVQFL